MVAPPPTMKPDPENLPENKREGRLFVFPMAAALLAILSATSAQRELADSQEESLKREKRSPKQPLLKALLGVGNEKIQVNLREGRLFSGPMGAIFGSLLSSADSIEKLSFASESLQNEKRQ